MIQTVQVPVFMWTSLGCVALAVLVASLGKIAAPAPTSSPLKVTKELMLAAKQKLATAEQDSDALHRLGDAHTGLAYINSARMLTPSDKDLEGISEVHPGDLHAALQAVVSHSVAFLSKKNTQ
jgi:hypothetical protein